MKLTTIIIFLMAMLNLVPPLFAQTEYFDNSYYIILFLLLSFVGISLPFIVDGLHKQLKRISILLGSWFFGGLVMELFNLTVPLQILNSNQNNIMYFKVLVCFIIGVSVIMSSEIWSSQKKY
jgi:hypothetical protein